MRSMAGSRRRNAALAAAVLAPAVAAAAWLDAPLSLAAVGAGAAGTLALELLLSARADRVRARWSNPAVQAGSVVCVAAAAVAGVALVGAAALTARVSGLASYLLLLAFVTAADRRGRR